jgi:heat shock protein HtpX
MWEVIRANKRRAVVLIFGMAALLMAVGFALGELLQPGAGAFGLLIAFVIWVGLTLTSYFSGDKILLASSKARAIEKQDHPVLWNVVEEMTIAAGLPNMPAVYIIDQDAPNAFATGRDPETSAVAVTAGLLERLSRDELQGVIAHELGHIANRDILYMMVAGIMMGAVVMLADMGVRMVFWGGGRRRTSSDRNGGGQALIMVIAIVLAILAPILAQMMYFALSRRREYLADASAAVYTRYPEGLASALEKIASNTEELKTANRATAPMFIVNPLKLTKTGLSDLSRTHPPTSERVRILRSFAGGEAGLAGYDQAFRRITGRAVGVVPAGSLAASQEVTSRAAQADPRNHIERVRQATDAMWRLQDYTFMGCACGTSLKVPPAHQGKTLECPHCGTAHKVPAKPAP